MQAPQHMSCYQKRYTAFTATAGLVRHSGCLQVSHARHILVGSRRKVRTIPHAKISSVNDYFTTSQNRFQLAVIPVQVTKGINGRATRQVLTQIFVAIQRYSQGFGACWYRFSDSDEHRQSPRQAWSAILPASNVPRCYLARRHVLSPLELDVRVPL